MELGPVSVLVRVLVGQARRPHVFVLVWVVVMVLPSSSVDVTRVRVIVGVPMTHQSPHEKAESSHYQHGSDDVPLLNFDLLLKAQTHQRNHAGQSQRRHDVPPGGQPTDPRHTDESPSLGAGDDC